jgi:hypothetical protein
VLEVKWVLGVEEQGVGEGLEGVCVPRSECNVVNSDKEREGWIHRLVAGGIDVCEFEPSLDVGVEGVKETGQLLHRVVYLPRSSEDRYLSFPYKLVITIYRQWTKRTVEKEKKNLTPFAGSTRNRSL